VVVVRVGGRWVGVGKGRSNNLLPAGPAALEKGLFELGLGRVFGPLGELFAAGCDRLGGGEAASQPRGWGAMEGK
jgi:hypothetical protein